MNLAPFLLVPRMVCVYLVLELVIGVIIENIELLQKIEEMTITQQHLEVCMRSKQNGGICIEIYDHHTAAICTATWFCIRTMLLYLRCTVWDDQEIPPKEPFL
jgi:uncharacterized membrane protein (Fun14 family)